MAVISIVKLSELEGAKRLDAEYYQPTFVSTIKILKKMKKIFILGKIAQVVDGPFGSQLHAESYVKQGIPFLRVHNITNDGLLDLSDIVYISEADHERLKSSEALPGDVLITKTGWVGFSTVLTKEIPKCNYRADLAKIRIRIKELNPYFLAIFLNSKFGRFQTTRLMSGARGDRILARNIKQIIVPVINSNLSKRIEELYFSAIRQYTLSKSLYSRAESLLLSELGLQDFKPKEKLSYKVSLSEANTAHRIDAEYFNPKYDEIIEKIKNYKNGYGKLLNFVENIKPKFEPQKFPQQTFSYVELADIDTSIGVIQSSTIITGEEAPSRAKRILKKNDIIVSSVEGSLEKVALVDEQFEGSLASTGFFQFRPKNILPEVLLVLAKSTVIQTQLKKECAGTILTAVPKEAVKKIIIPILPKQTQQEIAKLVQESHEARRKAKQLLGEAKKKVEEAIERNFSI